MPYHFPMSDAERRAQPVVILGSGPSARVFSGADIGVAPGSPADNRAEVSRLAARVRQLEMENGELRSALDEMIVLAGAALRKSDSSRSAAPNARSAPKRPSSPAARAAAAPVRPKASKAAPGVSFCATTDRDRLRNLQSENQAMRLTLATFATAR